MLSFLFADLSVIKEVMEEADVVNAKWKVRATRTYINVLMRKKKHKMHFL